MLADIIVAVDEPLDTTQCGGTEDCQGQPHKRCMTHDLWSNLNRRMFEYLESVNLETLVADIRAKSNPHEVVVLCDEFRRSTSKTEAEAAA